MSYAQLNGAQIYYELYGAERPERSQVPILLIHGAAATGQSDWGLVGHLLARRYPVLVPDCRGHGHSTNPRESYSFHEMAADMVELILRLGYERAHVIGHGNGGNIALVTLLEYPEVVQTCTLQAANSYVSPDLAYDQPDVWDPDRIEEQSPDWMRAMVERHGPMHGREYWRELARLTLAETVNQPNYTPEDLALVRRPVLVIQGEWDRINAPARHGQFLAEHIPEAEWWFPEGAGHGVHQEIPWPWTERVLDFLHRRGDPANNALDRLAAHRYADRRATIFEVRAEWIAPGAAGWAEPGGNGRGPESDEEAWWPTPAELPSIRVSGQVLEPGQRVAALEALEAASLNVAGISDEIQVLLDETTPAAVVNVTVADMFSAPEAQVERVNQALLGEPVRILGETDGWTRVRLEDDGYVGWLQSATLLATAGGSAGLQEYRAAPQAIVAAPAAAVHAAASHNSAQVGLLPLGLTLPVAVSREHWIALSLPDGQRGWVAAADALELEDGETDAKARMDRALWLIGQLIGAPYLPGGRTAFGCDAAGLAQIFLRLLGLRAPRDADQQYRAGQPVEGAPEAGDLLFFAAEASRTDSRQPARFANISHVAVSLGGWEVIQAGGGSLSVNRLTLDPASGPAAAWLREHLAGIRRFVGQPGPT